jgi:hypothetical protein
MMVLPNVSRPTMASAFSRCGAQRDQQVGLAGPGVTDQAQRLALADPVAVAS